MYLIYFICNFSKNQIRKINFHDSRYINNPNYFKNY